MDKKALKEDYDKLFDEFHRATKTGDWSLYFKMVKEIHETYGVNNEIYNF